MDLGEFIERFGRERDHHQQSMATLYHSAFRSWMEDYANENPEEPRVIALKEAGLAAADGFYIWGYTGSCSSWLNSDMRDGNDYGTEGKRYFAEGLETALSKLPSFEGITWRWEQADENLRKFTWFKDHIGLHIRVPYFLSTALDDITSESMLWKIKAIPGGRGRFIGPMSNAPAEQEVLFLPNAKFKITGVGDDNCTVYMEELPAYAETEFELCGVYDHDPKDIDPDMTRPGLFDNEFEE